MTHIAKNRIKSAWTPMSNEQTNNKIFEERRDLIEKWFKHWNDDQRKKIIECIMNKSKIGQLEYARDVLSKRVPIYKDDFTRSLPRVLSLYVFSFLDPRSLCRCAQVSWHWRYTSESDQLWISKCLRYGWTLPFTPSQFEQGVWKRNYIENIQAIQSFRTSLPPPIDISPIKRLESSGDKDADQEKRSKSTYEKPGTRPWLGSDKRPVDINRFNYFDNDDEVEKIRKLRQKGLAGIASKNLSEKITSKIKTGTHVKNTQSLRVRSKSLTKLSTSISSPMVKTEQGDRPLWATKPITDSLELRSSVDASVRPPPVKPLVAKKRVQHRTPRDPPSVDLFPNQPWTIPKNDDDSD